jgi:hypothetical protein
LGKKLKRKTNTGNHPHCYNGHEPAKHAQPSEHPESEETRKEPSKAKSAQNLHQGYHHELAIAVEGEGKYKNEKKGLEGIKPWGCSNTTNPRNVFDEGGQQTDIHYGNVMCNNPNPKKKAPLSKTEQPNQPTIQAEGNTTTGAVNVHESEQKDTNGNRNKRKYNHMEIIASQLPKHQSANCANTVKGQKLVVCSCTFTQTENDVSTDHHVLHP